MVQRRACDDDDEEDDDEEEDDEDFERSVTKAVAAQGRYDRT